MPPIGDTLREARMRQRMDIADVEERTKIRAKYLRALENEEWGLLPGPTFVRTFLRTYAEAVGLDPHPLVEEYRAAHDSGEEPDSQPQPLASRKPRAGARGARPERRRRRAPGPPGAIALIAGLVVALVLFLLVLGLAGGKDESGDKAARTDTARTTTRRTQAKPRKAPRAAIRGVTLRIAPTEPTYLCVDAGEGSGRVFEGILEQARTFKNARELRANLGKRSVKVSANGKGIAVENNASPLGLRVTKAGGQEITNGQRPCG